MGKVGDFWVLGTFFVALNGKTFLYLAHFAAI